MVVRICIEEVVGGEANEKAPLTPAERNPGDNGTILARVHSTSANTTPTAPSYIHIANPFNDKEAYGNLDPEFALKWLLEKHVVEPFETTKASFAAEALNAYGQNLASQLLATGTIRKREHLELEIISSENVVRPSENNATLSTFNLQGLHWEVVEDSSLWPSTNKPKTVSVIRSLRGSFDNGAESIVPGEKKFKILLVVSRPKQQEDIDYGLVSRLLVSILKQTATQVNASLTILRPPTWEAFRDHLQDNSYDLVHLDMHGRVKSANTGGAVAQLAFCKPDLLDPLKLKAVYKPGIEVAKVLAEAEVKTVVLNACESATSQYTTTDANLAQVLLRHGVRSVIAMAYQVVDEAVEVFMNVFYHSLLIEKMSAGDSVRASRQALMQNRQRRGVLMYKVSLPDYIVPVLYTHVRNHPSAPSRREMPVSEIAVYFEKVLKSVKRILPTTKETSTPITSAGPSLIGRDVDIQALEILLPASRTVLLHGPGGCGKSELLRYLCQWWKISGWIKGSAFVDFAKDRPFMLSDILRCIGKSIGLDENSCTKTAIVDKLNSGKHLIIFDSEDVLSSPCKLDMIDTHADLESSITSFLRDIILDTSSMVIICSRLSTPRIGHITSERQKYHLSGIGVLGSVDLLQQLAFQDDAIPPETYHRRENIDYLRRVAIILEGNPAAIQIVVPAFKKTNYDGKAFHQEVLFGTCGLSGGGDWSCRMVRSVYGSLIIDDLTKSEESLMYLYQYGVFWNIMPKDLTNYYWFLYISISKYYQEGAYANWISQEFQDIVQNAQMARNLRKFWPGIEEKMIAAGLISHATITTLNGNTVPCYHVHPIFTLLSREHLPKEARFGYIRHALLWEHRRDRAEGYNFVNVEWDGIQQHEDFLHNMRAIALAWSIDDGNLNEEIERMGVSLYDVTYTMCINALHMDGRTAELFLPIIWKQVLRLYMLVNLIRTDSVPTSRDLDSILSYSEVLYRLETSESVQISVVKNALDAYETYRKSPGAQELNVPQQLSWFQLRHAEAALTTDPYEGRALYARNLADDPSFGPNGDKKNLYYAIRRVQLQNITNWAACDVQIAAREKTLDKIAAQERLKEVSGAINLAGGMTRFFENTLSEHKDAIAALRVRDQCAFSLERDETAVAKFGNLARSILDCRLTEIFADVVGSETQLLDFVQEMAQSDTWGNEMQSKLGFLESTMHMFAGDMTSAASALGSNLQREALSSTSSTRWETIADLHMHMYALAVMRTDPPDYSKGLTHLEQWWKQHGGVGVPKKDLCFARLKFATCYDGLDRVAEAAREILKIVQEILPAMTSADLSDGEDANSFVDWLYERFAELKKLDVFLEPTIIWSAPDNAPQVTWQERTLMYHIMTKAHETKKGREELDAAAERLEETLEEANKMMKTFNVVVQALKDQPDASEETKEMARKFEESERLMNERTTARVKRAPVDRWLE